MNSVSLSRFPADLITYDNRRWTGAASLVLSFFLNVASLVLVSEALSRRERAMEIIPVEVARFDSLTTVSSAPEEQPKAEAVPTPPPEVPKEEHKEIPNIVKKIAAKPERKQQIAPLPLPPAPSAPAQSPSAAGADTFGIVPGIEAEPIEQIKPEIPDSLRNHEYKAYVRLKVEVQINGSATPFLKTSSGNEEIDSRVLEAVRKWKWRPGTVDGKAVPSVRYFKFEFEVR